MDNVIRNEAVTEKQVRGVFKSLLMREPESAETILNFMRFESLESVINAVAGSQEYQQRIKSSPLWHYTASFDAIATVIRHEDKNRTAVIGHRVNHVGVAVNVNKFFPTLNLDNIVEEVPLPANWHADIAEFAAAFRALEYAKDTFVMAELGCGWGCWMNMTGVAARRLGKEVFLIGIEGDEGHVQFAHESMATNGFSKDQYKIFRGVAAGHTGTAFFPKQNQSGAAWGLEPIFDVDPAKQVTLRKTGNFDELPMLALSDIIGRHAKLDLLHIDIQGGETAFIRETLAILNQKVAYILVGTHSRVIDGQIIDILLSDGGWELEIERPCLHGLVDGKLVTYIDGVQGWKNKRLLG